MCSTMLPTSLSTASQDPLAQASAPKRSALAMARRDELPWQMTTRPRTPEQIGAPVLLRVQHGAQPRSAGRSSMPPDLGPEVRSRPPP